MTRISHIVTNGCSFTEGNGLANKEESWPHRLAQRLGVDVVNIGKGGSANDTILRRTYEYFYEDIHNNNHPLYVIMFSAITRKERWFEGKKEYGTYDTFQKDPGSVDYVLNYNMDYFYKRTMLYKSALRNLFQLHDVPYMFSLAIETLNGTEKDSMYEKMSKQAPNHFSILCGDKNDIGDLAHITEGSPLTPCGHWEREGHTAVAHHLYTKIYENYKNIEIAPSKNYLNKETYVNAFEPKVRL
jgi:hypothetical protein